MSNKVLKKVNKYNEGGLSNTWFGKNVGGVIQAASGAMGLASNLANDLKGNQAAMEATKAGINQVNSTTFNAGNTSGLMSQWSSANYMDPVTSKQYRSDKGAMGMLTGALEGASAGASLGPWGAIAGAAVGIGTGLAGWLGGKAKAKKRADKDNQLIAQANDRLDRNFETAVDNLEEQQLNNALMNYAAYGGPLESNGITWPSELMFINNGGTHEENPNEGIQIGVDSQGVPNLVEEGEVIYGDYVFSNRLKVPKEIRKELKLGKKDITFADAVEKFAKESEERPNDAISKAGLEANLNKLIASQEGVRDKRSKSNVNYNNMFAIGGPRDKDYIPLTVPESASKVKLPTKVTSPFESFNIAKTTMDAAANAYLKDKIASNNNSEDEKFNWATLTRYAPVVGNAVALLTNKADYTNANAMANAINNADAKVSFTPLGEYLKYEPRDINYLANKINAQSGATRRSILNSNTNRGMANASLIASDFNTILGLGEAYRQGLEYNQGLKERVASFNRATNQYNSQTGLQTDMFNAENKRALLNAKMQELAMREAERNNYENAKSANLTSLFDNLGAIGTEAYNREVIENLPLYYNEKGKYKAACGGKIKRRRK